MDFTFNNSKTPVKGSLLISEPFGDDQYFSRSVILLCDHNNKGSFGFVLNNYINVDLHTLNARLPKSDSKISVGGPVDKESIYYFHRFGNRVEGSILLKEDLYFGGNFDQILELLNDSESNFRHVRFFIGYAGWSENQLKSEIDENLWVVTDSYSIDDIFDTSNHSLWKELLAKQGGKFKIISEFPINPSNN